MTHVQWPNGHEPAGAAIHEVTTGSSLAPPEAVWAWLVRPDRWSDYYSNVQRVRHVDGPWPEVAMGTVFSWVTFNVPVTTEITEYQQDERLAWTGKGLGARGHHGWVLTARDDGGTDIHTEETQHGALLKLLGVVLAPRMRRMHQVWVDNLARTAERGAPQ